MAQLCFWFSWEIQSASKYAPSTPPTSQLTPAEKSWQLAEAERSFSRAPTCSLATGSPAFGRVQPGGPWLHAREGLGGQGALHVLPKERWVGSCSHSRAWCCSPFLAGGDPRHLLPGKGRSGAGGGGLQWPPPTRPRTSMGNWNEKSCIVGTSKTLPPSFTPTTSSRPETMKMKLVRSNF